jgi:hypothetical protein
MVAGESVRMMAAGLLVESRMRRKSQVRFGGAERGN